MTAADGEPLRTDPGDDARAWQRLFDSSKVSFRTMASLASPTAARLWCPTNRSRSAVRGDLIGNRLQNAPSEDLRQDAGVHRLDDHRRCVARVGVHHEIARQQQPAPALLRSVLYDLPQVIAGAPALLRQQGVEDRVA
jgi:hypothetical protein